MKKLILIPLAIVLLATSCEKETPLNGKCIKVKLINQFCGQAVLQVLDTDYYSIAQDTWTSHDDQEYKHVFGTTLACDPVENGDIFYVNIVEKYDQSCAVCFALYTNMPEPYYNVSIAEKCE